MTRRLEPIPAPSDVDGFKRGYGRSAQARELYVAGASTFEIAVYLRMAHASVRRAVRELPPAKPAPFTPEDGNANEDQFFAQWARKHRRVGARQMRPSDATFRRVYG